MVTPEVVVVAAAGQPIEQLTNIDVQAQLTNDMIGSSRCR